MVCTEGDAAEACANCGAPLTGPCCAQCGQRVFDRLTLGGLLRGALGQLLDLEGPLLNTFRAACRSPGGAARRWVDGERMRFVHPLKYALLASTALAGTLALLRPTLTPFPVTDAADAERLYFLNGVLLPYLALLNALAIAGLQRLLFLRAPFNVAECWMSGLFVNGQIALLTAVLLPLGMHESIAGLAVTTVIGIALGIWALVGFYARPLLQVIGRGLLLGIASVVGINVIGSGAGALLIALGLLPGS